MRRAACVLLLAATWLIVSLPSAASAKRLSDGTLSLQPCSSYQAFTVYGRGRRIAAIERAASIESSYLAEYYRTPCATFVPAGGWAIYLSGDAYETAVCGDEALACHAVNQANGEPYAVIGMGQPGFLPRATVFIHEVLEALADPDLDNMELEVCDQFNGYTFKLAGVQAPVFSLPDGSEF